MGKRMRTMAPESARPAVLEPAGSAQLDLGEDVDSENANIAAALEGIRIVKDRLSVGENLAETKVVKKRGRGGVALEVAFRFANAVVAVLFFMICVCGLFLQFGTPTSRPPPP